MRVFPKALFCALFAIATLIQSGAGAQTPRPFAQPNRIRYDRQCFTIDGKDMFLYSGAFHYFRCPKALWRDRFQKIKAAGFNCVETYAAWNWAERQMPASVNDFSHVDVRDLDAWLTMAEEYGLYAIVRPGPYICAEWDGGGFPQWLIARKKPATPLRSEAWLRSDDPVYLAWCRHWYQAVCPIIAKHQITRKKPGQPGVILVQIENEYDFSPKMPDAVKVNQLTALAADAKANGINVPLISCWTKQIRGVKAGPLRGVFDCPNFYPRWNVAKDLGTELPRLRAQQPDAPLMTTEMQGGWFAKVGGMLSEQQEGVTAAQIQNLSLYAIQKGETAMSYYMIFGGTNFDDWGGRDQITSYDYNAPIRESGGVSERYQRVWALGHMLKLHGPKLARSQAVPITATATEADVQVAERRARDGSRYLFVRTENHASPRTGTIHVQEKGDAAVALTFNYQLEPFGSRVLYLPSHVTDARKGVWLPKPAPAVLRPTHGLPAPIAITAMQRRSDPLPTAWTPLKPGQKVEDFGVYNRHFLYYRVAANPGASFTVRYDKGDGVLAFAGSRRLSGPKDQFTLPSNAREAVLLYENAGQPNIGSAAEMERLNGIKGVKTDSTDLPVEFAGGERERGLRFSQFNASLEISQWKKVVIAKDAAPAPDAPLTWYRATFALPPKNPAVWVPWQLHLEAAGNGFLYLNGHCLGRYWQAGPQHNFYLPETWLHYGPGKQNVLALDLRPVNKGVRVQAAVIEPNVKFAEKRQRSD